MEQGLIRHLRGKFIAINMALAFLVLLITFGTVCVLNHATSVNTINTYLNSVLSRTYSSLVNPTEQVEGVRPLNRADVPTANISLLGNMANGLGGGALAQPNLTPNIQERTSTQASPEASQDDVAANDGANSNATNHGAASGTGRVAEDAGASASATATPPIIGSGQLSADVLTAVFKVESNGIYTAMPAYTTATIPESVLLRADETVINGTSDRGYLQEYDLMYERMPLDDGWLVAYANAYSTHSWQHLAVLLGLVGLIALVVFFLINIVFSQWATRPVADSIQRQQQFTADASHELKTPLTVILANLSILRSHADSTVAEQMQWVESSETEAHRMQLLVNDMLSLARPEAEEERAQAPVSLTDPVDLSDLVEGEVLQFESVAFDRGILLDSRIQEGVTVAGDAEKLGRMTSTLIDNACKYVETNGLVDVTLSVETPGAVTDPVAYLRVHNTGEPIPAGELEHLFDRFYRADKARTGGKGGYGLGLAIGQQIAHEHGGEITVSSSADAGTTFTVTLPLYDE